MLNLSSEKMQVLLFKTTGTILTAFLLADLYGELLAAGLDLTETFRQQFE